MSRRQLRGKVKKTRRHAPPAAQRPTVLAPAAVRSAQRVERLAYSRTQAAAALGVSRSTFDRRVLPHVEAIEMPWGTKLIPVDELERLLAERRRPARPRPTPRQQGRPPAVPRDLVERIRAEHAAGKGLGQIARGLTADSVPTAHGARQWWPSTVRAVLLRTAAD